MARLSEEHRNIVPVYDAAICADGRPYLIMQYCPQAGPGQAVQGRADRRWPRCFPSACSWPGRSSPRTGRASCTGTSSRPTCSPRGPGRPALTDFGIAVTAAAAEDPERWGVDPVEPAGAARRRTGRRRPLGRVLAGRHPLHAVGPAVPAGARGPADHPGRPAVPHHPDPRAADRPGRHPALAGAPAVPRAWPRTPALRYPSAAQLARALQQVQHEIGEPVTDFEFLAADPGAELADLAPDAADHTRVRPIVIRAQGADADQDGVTRMRGADDPARNRSGRTRSRTGAPRRAGGRPRLSPRHDHARANRAAAPVERGRLPGRAGAASSTAGGHRGPGRARPSRAGVTEKARAAAGSAGHRRGRAARRRCADLDRGRRRHRPADDRPGHRPAPPPRTRRWPWWMSCRRPPAVTGSATQTA